MTDRDTHRAPARWRLAVAVGIGCAAACTALPLKQRATHDLVATQHLLIAAQDAERQLCNPTAPKDQPITHCTGAVAQTVGLTDARHRQLAEQFADAFVAHGKAAHALIAWKAGDPVPADLATLGADVRAALMVATHLSGSPDVATVATALQRVLDAVTAVTQALKGGL